MCCFGMSVLFWNVYCTYNLRCLVGAFEKMLSLQSLSLCESPTDLSQTEKNFKNYSDTLLKGGQSKLNFLGFCGTVVQL